VAELGVGWGVEGGGEEGEREESNLGKICLGLPSFFVSNHKKTRAMVIEWRGGREGEGGGRLGLALDRNAKRNERERRKKGGLGVVWFKFKFNF
jgi:hypothetical protein